jgi:hypothetical protein
MPQPSDDDEMHEFHGEVLAETELAWKFADGRRAVWLPKSQCEWDEPTMLVPEWLAIKTGLA